MYLHPLNSDLNTDTLRQLYPEMAQIYDEVWKDSEFPEGAKKGNSAKTVQYEADGEASDWMLTKHGIFAASPELGSDDILSNEFYWESTYFKDVVLEIMTDNYPWIWHTIKKLGVQIGFKLIDINWS